MLGRLNAVVRGAVANVYNGYDEYGRITSFTQNIDTQSYTTTYTYDLIGNLKSEVYPSGRRVNYTTYDDGRVASFTFGATNAQTTVADQIGYTGARQIGQV